MWYDAFLDWRTYVDIYLIWILVFFLIKFAFSNKKVLTIMVVAGFIFIIGVLVKYFEIGGMSGTVYQAISGVLVIALLVILAPDIRRYFEVIWKPSHKKQGFEAGSESTRDNIVNAVVEMSRSRTGALITIEKYNTLEQFSERAVAMDSLVTKELLLNIFIDKSPLHDGAVIIRGDRIVCAGAYYILSESEAFEKTTGSRHRAGLGISEITDSLTIIVSEETGNVSVALNGILIIAPDRDKLMSRLNTFMK